MDPDIALVLGLSLAALTIPSVLSAASDRRAPRASAITILIAGLLVLYALNSRPTGYQLSEVPAAFARVIASFTR